MTRQQWLQRAEQDLLRLGPPSPETLRTLPEDVWITEQYLLFDAGWASYAIHTMHASERIGDIALLRAADGSLYISDFHYCVGLEGEFDGPRPKDVYDFLLKYETKYRWKPYSGEAR